MRIPDSVLRKYALYRDYIIVTRDHDFVKSFRSRKVPEKMLFVHEEGTRSVLIDTFDKWTEAILTAFEKHDFTELSTNGLRFPFSHEK